MLSEKIKVHLFCCQELRPILQCIRQRYQHIVRQNHRELWVKILYKQAEEKAEDSSDYESLAESLRDQLGDKKWAKLADQKAKELEDDDYISSSKEGSLGIEHYYDALTEFVVTTQTPITIGIQDLHIRTES